MKFKEWLLQEVGTTTADIATFRRMSIPLVRRIWPPSVATMFADKLPRKVKPRWQPQVKEYAVVPGDVPQSGGEWWRDPIRQVGAQSKLIGRLRGEPPQTQSTVPPPTEESGIPLRLGYGVYVVFQRYWEGQGDPLYAVLSRRGDSVDWVTVFASPEEVERLAEVAEEILQKSDDQGERNTAEHLLKQLEKIS